MFDIHPNHFDILLLVVTTTTSIISTTFLHYKWDPLKQFGPTLQSYEILNVGKVK